MKKKKIIIFIPGAYDLSYYPNWLKNICVLILRFVGIKPLLSDHKTIWKKELRSREGVIWMKWTRLIDPISVWLAKRKLKRILRQYKNQQVWIVGTSLATKIVLDTVNSEVFNNIKKLILVCGVLENKKINLPNAEIINFYSKKDALAKVATGVYSLNFNGLKLRGKNVKNICLGAITHRDFCMNVKIKSKKFKGKKITQIVNEFLR